MQLGGVTEPASGSYSVGMAVMPGLFIRPLTSLAESSSPGSASSGTLAGAGGALVGSGVEGAAEVVRVELAVVDVGPVAVDSGASPPDIATTSTTTTAITAAAAAPMPHIRRFPPNLPVRAEGWGWIALGPSRG